MSIVAASNKEIISELLSRINKNKLMESDFDSLYDFFDDYEPVDALPHSTLEDQMKRDWMIEHWDDFTSFDLDNFLKIIK